MATLGATIALIVLSVGGIVLLVLAVVMIIGAIMPRRSEITSWPMQQEQAFQPFNSRNQGSHSTAWVVSLISAFAMLFIVVGIYFGVKPEIRDIGKSMNMSNLTKKSRADAPKADAPKPEAPKAEAPKTETPAAEPKTEDKPADDKK
jgi:hypothetical protein